jgi:hypothetical protein
MMKRADPESVRAAWTFIAIGCLAPLFVALLIVAFNWLLQVK